MFWNVCISYLLSSEKATKILSILQHKTAMKLRYRRTHHMCPRDLYGYSEEWWHGQSGRLEPRTQCHYNCMCLCVRTYVCGGLCVRHWLNSQNSSLHWLLILLVPAGFVHRNYVASQLLTLNSVWKLEHAALVWHVSVTPNIASILSRHMLQ